MKKLILPVLFICQFLMFSCSGLFNPKVDTTQTIVTIHGTASFEGAVPDIIAPRTAVSDGTIAATTTDVDKGKKVENIKVVATKGSEKDEAAVYLIQGSATEEEEKGFYQFEISVNVDDVNKWKFDLVLFDDTTSESDVILATENVLVKSDSVPSVNFVVYPSTDVAIGTGSVELQINFEPYSNYLNSDISYEYDFLDANGNSLDSDYDYSFDWTGGKINLTAQNLSAGVYTFYLIVLYKRTTILYHLQEKINVYPNLKTNTWVGNSEYITDNGTIKITADHLATFKRTTVFVKEAQYSSKLNGSQFSPYNKFKDAYEEVQIRAESSTDDADKTYTIYVLSDLVIEPTNIDVKNLKIIALNANTFEPLTGTDQHQFTMQIEEDATSGKVFINKTTGGLLQISGICFAGTVDSESFSNSGLKVNLGDKDTPGSLNISNCYFQDCAVIEEGGAGALYVTGSGEVTLEKVNFYYCTSNVVTTNTNQGLAIKFQNEANNQIQAELKNCNISACYIPQNNTFTPNDYYSTVCINSPGSVLIDKDTTFDKSRPKWKKNSNNTYVQFGTPINVINGSLKMYGSFINENPSVDGSTFDPLINVSNRAKLTIGGDTSSAQNATQLSVALGYKVYDDGSIGKGVIYVSSSLEQPVLADFATPAGSDQARVYGLPAKDTTPGHTLTVADLAKIQSFKSGYALELDSNNNCGNLKPSGVFLIPIATGTATFEVTGITDGKVTKGTSTLIAKIKTPSSVYGKMEKVYIKQCNDILVQQTTANEDGSISVEVPTWLPLGCYNLYVYGKINNVPYDQTIPFELVNPAPVTP